MSNEHDTVFIIEELKKNFLDTIRQIKEGPHDKETALVFLEKVYTQTLDRTANRIRSGE